MNCFPGRLEFKKNVQAVTRSLEPRNYAGFRFRWYPQLITYLPLAYTSRYKPWESLWSSSATTPLVDFHHRLTACPSYLETCAARRTLYKKSGRQSMNSVGQIFHFNYYSAAASVFSSAVVAAAPTVIVLEVTTGAASSFAAVSVDASSV